MSGVRVRFRRLPAADPALPLPGYQTAGAAGMDLLANLPAEDRATGFELRPGARAAVPTGIAVEIPEGYEIQVRPRSGLALRHGITLLNSPGTIDSDYRGEIQIPLINLDTESQEIEHGERVAQLLVALVHPIEWAEAESLPPTERGTGGFGSTGR